MKRFIRFIGMLAGLGVIVILIVILFDNPAPSKPSVEHVKQ
ncbi:MAG TPA: hypothetical protein VKB04_03595 [Anaerolineales bacterium]|nr:hypothetical protein [Anaerolineales bacterium]